MGKIYCICGKSSTGKDTIYKRILEDKSLNLKTIVPYTTRPIRDGEKNGREYFFIDDEEAQRLDEEGKVVESRAYNTVHGIWKYLTVDNGDIDLTGNDYLIIGTLESYIKSSGYFGKDKIVPIYVEVDDGERLARAVAREREEANHKYAELCRRFLADAEDFSEEKIEDAEIDIRFINDNLEKCIDEIKDYIRNN